MYRRNSVTLILLILLSSFVFADAPSLYRKGLDAYERGDKQNLARSVDYFQQAINKNPFYTQAWRGLGLAYFRLGYYTQALPALERALEQQPNNLETNLALVEVLLALNEDQKAREILDHLLELAARNPQILFLDALWWSKNKRDDLALERLEAVFALAPQHLSGLILKGNLLFERSQSRLAEEIFKSAVWSHPRNARAHYEQGLFFFRQGRWHEAAKALQTAYNLNKEFVLALEPLGRCYYVLKDYQKAAQTISLLVPHNSNDHSLIFLLAQTSARLAGENNAWRESARTNFINALRLKNNDEIIRYLFEEFASDHLSLKSSERGQLSDYHLQLGNFWLERNHDTLAEIAYRRAIRLNPYSRIARGNLAKLSRKNHLNERYLNELVQLSEIDPNNTRLADNILYYKSILPRLPSRRRNIRQYEISSTLPRIWVSDLFEPWDNLHPYLELGSVFGNLLRDALTPDSKLVLLRPEKNEAVNTTEVAIRRQAISKGADFFLHGRYVLGNNSVRIEIKLCHSKTGRVVSRFTSSRVGNHSLFEVAADLAKKVSESIPIIGQIIGIQGNEITVNLGKTQGVDVGTILEVYPSADFRNNWLEHIGETRIGSPLGEIKIHESDEAVSFGELIRKSTFSGVTTYQYLIIKPENK